MLQFDDLCQNNGVCKPACDEGPLFYACECTKEWTGQNCTDKVKLYSLMLG